MEVPFITYYSAIVATVSLIVAGSLAVVKFIEYRRDSRGIAVGYAWTGDQIGSDMIFLTNLSAIPIPISYWTMEWHERRFLSKPKITPIHIYDDEDLHFTLMPRARHTVEFTDQHRFSWSPKNKSNAILFIRLKVTGRKKPLLLNVTSN